MSLYKCLVGRWLSARHCLRSTSTLIVRRRHTCVIQRTRTRLGDLSFAVAGPRLCNSLPVGRCHINLSIGQFRSALKTHLFSRAPSDFSF